jgi:glutamate-ammonia-ligase adenylyltransferase
VTTFGAFEEYQHRQAWTWEHQALVRARPVAGDPELGERFRAIRGEVLAREREPETLRAEVRDMRRRMREEHGSRDPERFHLKQDTGGIADIEFIVQYMVLRWAGSHPQLLEYTDNIRILEAAERAGILAPEDARLLMDAYRAYRARVHRLALQDQPAVVPATEFRAPRERVAAIWARELEID